MSRIFQAKTPTRDIHYLAQKRGLSLHSFLLLRLLEIKIARAAFSSALRYATLYSSNLLQ